MGLAITGASGGVGGGVARQLAQAGHELTLFGRDAARIPDLPGSTKATFDYADGPAARAALEEVTTLLMVSAAESAERVGQHRTLIDAAKAAGVEQIVYTSFMNAAADAVFTLARDHWATERYLRESGLEWTILRDCFYADVMPHFVGEDGVIRGPAGSGRVAVVAKADVVRCAAVVMDRPQAHVKATYELTGPEALTMAEIAEVISSVQGRPVRFHDETVQEAHESRLRWAAPQWQVDAWVSTYTSIAAGEQEKVSADVEALTGRRALTLVECLRG